MKVLKYLFELIFVFLLPICFIFISFRYKTINQYDSSGNLISVEKVLDYSDNSLLRDYNDNLTYKYVVNDFNLWNEEYQLGYWSLGYFQPSEDGFLSSVDYISVVPNSNYFYYNGKYQDTSSVFYIAYFDSDYSFIRRDTITYNNNNIILTPNDCYYIQFSTQSNYGTVYLFDICINKSISWANGNYVSYGEDFIFYSSDELTGYSVRFYNYTWYSNFFNNFFNELQFNHNSFAKLIIIYLVMTIVFFFFWNLIYWPLSLLFRFLLWKKSYY